MENLDFIGRLENSDIESCVLVQQAYKDYAFGEGIVECGFNEMSRYVYIALENGVQIASRLGQDVEYISYDYDTGGESFFNTYEDALENRN